MDIPPVEFHKSVGEVGKDKPRQIERYLPEGYPQFLYQGTSVDNANTVKDKGLRGGTLSTWVFDCFDSRFYRKDTGRLLIVKIDEGSRDVFTTDDLGSKQEPYQYYEIRSGTGPEEEYTFTRVDTDGRVKITTQKSDRYVSPDYMGSIQFSQGQREFFSLYFDLLEGRLIGVFNEGMLKKVETMLRANNLPDSAAGVAGSGVTQQMLLEAGLRKDEDLEYRIMIRQREMAGMLGMDPSHFRDFETLQASLINLFSNEEGFLNKIVQQFPGLLEWDWKNISEDDETVTLGIVQQIYQKGIIDKIKAKLLHSGSSPDFLLLPGKSVVGLRTLT